MSSLIPPISGSLSQPRYNQRHLALLKKILEKTRQNKIKWVKLDTGYMAIVPNMRFVFQSSASAWRTFVVIVVSKEILRIQNSSVPALISQLVGLEGDPVLETTTELFNLISRAEADDVEGAINALDQL